MGLTFDSTKKKNLKDIQIIEKKKDNQTVIALAGNPNTGKSTVFNALTGLKTTYRELARKNSSKFSRKL